jgi:hypothetical protein
MPWGSQTPIRSRGRPVVLVDEPAEQVPSADVARLSLADRTGVVVVAMIVAALGCAVEPVEEDPPERLGGLVLG